MKQTKTIFSLMLRGAALAVLATVTAAATWAQTTPTVTAGQNVTKVTVGETATEVTDEVRTVPAAAGSTVKITAAKPEAGKVARLKLTKAESADVEVTSVGVNPVRGGDILQCGFAYQMSASVTPDNATDKTVTWSVDNTDKAAINAETGILLAKKDGSVTVSAFAKKGVGGGTTMCIVNNANSPSIFVYTDKGHKIDGGDPVTLHAYDASGNLLDDSKLKWTISDGSDCASIENNNVLYVKKDGNSIVRVDYYADGNMSGDPTYSSTVTFDVDDCLGSTSTTTNSGISQNGEDYIPDGASIWVKPKSDNYHVQANSNVEMQATGFHFDISKFKVTWSISGHNGYAAYGSSIDADTGQLNIGPTDGDIVVTATVSGSRVLSGSCHIQVIQ